MKRYDMRGFGRFIDAGSSGGGDGGGGDGGGSESSVLDVPDFEGGGLSVVITMGALEIVDVDIDLPISETSTPLTTI